MIRDLSPAQVQAIAEQRYARVLELEELSRTDPVYELNERGKQLLKRARFTAYLDLRESTRQRRNRALRLRETWGR